MNIRIMIIAGLSFCYAGIVNAYPYIWIKNDYKKTLELTIDGRKQEIAPDKRVQLLMLWPKSISVREKGSINPVPHKHIAEVVKKVEATAQKVADFEATISIFDSGSKTHFGYRVENVKKLDNTNKSIEQKFFDEPYTGVDAQNYLDKYAVSGANTEFGLKVGRMIDDFRKKKQADKYVTNHPYVQFIADIDAVKKNGKHDIESLLGTVAMVRHYYD